MECLRETNFIEARTVNKGEFLYFLDLCVRKVNILEQMAVVTLSGWRQQLTLGGTLMQ